MVRTVEGMRIADRASHAFVRERLHVTERRKRDLVNDKKWLEIGLERRIGREALNRYEELVHKKAERVFLTTRAAQKLKLSALLEGRSRRSPARLGVTDGLDVAQERWVVNLSRAKLTEDEVSVLRRGLNFAPAPQRVPILDVVASVECALKSCKGATVEAAEAARLKVAGAIRRFSNRGKSNWNVSKEDGRALMRLRDDDDIVVLPADKGNATVVMDKADYNEKALSLLENHPFEVMKSCPKRKVEERINRFLWGLYQRRRMTKPLYDRLHASSCSLPRFYGLAKIHKAGVPLRPVISAVGSALYGVSKYLAEVLKPLVGKGGFTVSNSREFVAMISDVRISSDEEMVSFDVKSLYTSLPVERALAVVRTRLRDDQTLESRTPFTADEVTELLEICLTSTYFTFQEKYYRLTDGVAMGSPVSSVVANIFMEEFEERAISMAGQLEPSIWRRYVDDVFSILKRKNVERFLSHINQLDEQISFTVEREEDGCLPFLDVAMERTDTGGLRTSVYRKAMHTDRVLNFGSNHSDNARAAVVHALMGRVETHFAHDDVEGKNREKKHVMEVLRANGYPDHFIWRTVRRQENRNVDSRSGGLEERSVDSYVSVPYVRGMSEAIANILRPLGIKVAHHSSSWKWKICAGIKDRIPDSLRKGVVYCVPCQDCEAVYVGETLRNLTVRLQEHKRHVAAGDICRSAVAEHATTCDHRIDWGGAAVLGTEQRWRERKVKEALHISRQKNHGPVMNKDSGWALSAVWHEQMRS